MTKMTKFFFQVILWVFSGQIGLAQQDQPNALPDRPDPRLRAFIEEFKKTFPAEAANITVDPRQAVIFVGQPTGIATLTLVISNYRNSGNGGGGFSFAILNGLLDTNEVRQQVFQDAGDEFSLRDVPIFFQNSLFAKFYDVRFLKNHPHAYVVSKSGQRYPLHGGMAEIKPGFLITPRANLDQFVSYLNERPFEHDAISVVSLLNNEAANEAFSSQYSDFQHPKSISQLEKAVQKTKHKQVFLVGHIRDEYLVRYLSDGSESYRLPVRQFFATAENLGKDVVVIGCNFADDPAVAAPKGFLDRKAEAQRLADALQEKHLGELIARLRNDGQDSVTVTPQKIDGQDYKLLTIHRRREASTIATYDFVLFQTPAQPAVTVTGARWLFRYSGWIMGLLAIVEVLLLTVVRHPSVRIWKWVNMAIILFFLSMFMLSSLVIKG